MATDTPYRYHTICSVSVGRCWWTEDGEQRWESLEALQDRARVDLPPGDWTYYSVEVADEEDQEYLFRFGTVLDEAAFVAFVANYDWEYEGESGGIAGAPGLPRGIVPAFALAGTGISAAVCPTPDRDEYNFEDWDDILDTVVRRHFQEAA